MGEEYLKFFNESRHSAKALLRRPRFLILAVTIMALGIGAVAAMFSVVDSVLLSPLPYRNPERLVSMWEYDTKGDHLLNHVSPGDLEDWRRLNKSFDIIGSFDSSRQRAMALTGINTPTRLQVVAIDPAMLRVLGTQPTIGRWFALDEDSPGKDHLIILSYSNWESSFAKDPHVLGKDVDVDNERYTVVGVMPQGFTFPVGTGTADPSGDNGWQRPDAWIPLSFTPEVRQRRGGHSLSAIGRMRADKSLQEANAELRHIQHNILQQHPDEYVGSDARVISLLNQAVFGIRSTLLSLFGSVLFMLLVVCLNVANLFLIRGMERTRDYGVRMALGASRLLILWSAASEALFTCAIAGVFSVPVAYGLLRLFQALSPNNDLQLRSISLNPKMMLYALVISGFCGVFVGLLPALRAVRISVNTSLRDEGRGMSASRAASRPRDLAIVAEVSIGFAMLIIAGLMLQSFLRLHNTDPGFRPEGVVTMNIGVPEAKYKNAVEQRVYFDALLERLRAIPGVQSLGATTSLPMDSLDWDTEVNIEGRSNDPNSPTIMNYRAVDADYFRTMGIRLISGRLFTTADSPDSPHVALINEAAVRTYFHGANPVGKRIQQLPDSYFSEIVGVVADVKHGGLDHQVLPELYQPFDQRPSTAVSVVIHSNATLSAISPILARVVRSYDNEQPPPTIRELGDLVQRSVAKPEFRAWITGAIAGLTMVLACFGVYSSVAYVVALRRREICIRIVHGASRGAIITLIVGHMMWLVAIGLAVGIVLASFLGSLISTMLFGVRAYDVPTYLLVALGVVMMAFVSALGPALRSTHVNPREVLANE